MIIRRQAGALSKLCSKDKIVAKKVPKALWVLIRSSAIKIATCHRHGIRLGHSLRTSLWLFWYADIRERTITPIKMTQEMTDLINKLIDEVLSGEKEKVDENSISTA